MNTAADMQRMRYFLELTPEQQAEVLQRMLDSGLSPMTVARAAQMSLEALQAILADGGTGAGHRSGDRQ